MKLGNWILFLFCLAWFATFTSQSLVDLVDFLVVITALKVATKNKELAQLFKNFAPAKLWILWIFVLIVGLAINIGLSNVKPWQEALEFRWILTFLSLIYLTNIFVKSEESERQKILSVVSPLVLCMNLVAVVIYFVKAEPRAGGIMSSVMPFSHNLGMLFCFYLFICLNTDLKSLKKLDFIHLLVVVSGALLLFATLTRGAWIGAAGGILLTAFLVNKKLFTQVFVGLILVSTAVLATQPKIYDRFFGKTELEVASNNERVALWKGNFRIIQDYPIWGVGYQQNKNHLRKYYDEFGYPPDQRISHAHNQFLQNWGGTGTLGLLCYLAFLFFLLKPIVQSFKFQTGLSQYFQLGLIAAIVCFLIGGLTEANFNIAKNRMLFLLIAAWAYSMALQQKSKT